MRAGANASESQTPIPRRPRGWRATRLAAAGLAAAMVVAGAAGLLGCTETEQSPTSIVAPVLTTVTTAQNVVAQAKPFPTPAYIEPTPVDVGSVTNIDKVQLTSAQKEAIARQGFVATADLGGYQPLKFWHVYEEARYRGVPLLVTTDAVLNAYHTIFDTTLQYLEETTFLKRVISMSEALQGASSDQVNTATDPAVNEAALANEAYFAVGNSLLKGATTAPERVRDQVEAELALINAAGGLETSPILGYVEDYSQYKPRGHYTRSEELKRYFKAMMWYGHTAFWVNPKNPDVDEALARRLTRQAVLTTLALTGDTEQSWKAVYEPTSFMVGNADDLSAADMRPAMGVAFGSQTPALNDLGSDAKIDALRAELSKLPAPMILSHVNTDPPGTSQEEAERSFRVMGQRYIPDSYAFQQLVWRHVGTEDKPRLMPMGLDAMSVLGSDQAFEISKDTYGQDQYENWESQLMKVKAQFDTRSPVFWPANLYTGWLDSLREAMAFPPDGAPDLMKTRVWARKSLNTGLGSWTELRHDTILYAKQSVVAEGGGDEPPLTPGYVEPYPAFYEQMVQLATTSRDGLQSYGLLDQVVEDKLNGMIDLCTALKGIAEKELAGQPLTDDEKTTILYFGSTLEHLELFTLDDGRNLNPTDEKSPVVADVHTEYVNNMALEEGTGYPLVLYAVLEVDGKQLVLIGASYDYYEFTVPIAKRLTDEEWQAALDAGKAPPRPVWTNEFVVK